MFYKDSPTVFSQCVCVCQNGTTGPETHKSRDKETLKYLNLAKINKLRYSQHFIGCTKNPVLLGLLSALDQFAAT